MPAANFHFKGFVHIPVYGALPAPKPPWSLSDERKGQKLAGETPAPHIAAMGALGKSFLEVSPPRAKDFSAAADALAGLQEVHFSK